MLQNIIMFAADTVTANYTLDLSSIDLTPMVTMFQSAVPSILTACIPIIGMRKVIGLLFGTIKGA